MGAEAVPSALVTKIRTAVPFGTRAFRLGPLATTSNPLLIQSSSFLPSGSYYLFIGDSPKDRGACSGSYATPSAVASSRTGLGTTIPRMAQARETVRASPPRSSSALPSTTSGLPAVMSSPKAW